MFIKPEFNDLVRDVTMGKLELLSFILKEKYLLESIYHYGTFDE